MDRSGKTGRVPFVPIRGKRKSRFRAAALPNVKMSTLGFFGRGLWANYEEVRANCGDDVNRSDPPPGTFIS